MSKNFELLTNADEDRGLFRAVERKTSAPPQKCLSPRLGNVAREEVAKLVQRIFLLSGNGVAPRAVVFCGIEHGDGTSWICAQVARAVAEHGSNTVCAVDVNLRSPSLHGYLGAENRTGLGAAVRQVGSIRNFIEPGNMSNLWVLPAGLDGDPSVLLISDRFRERVKTIGYTVNYISCASLILLTLNAKGSWTTSIPYRLIAWIGLYSYSIYIWHNSVRTPLFKLSAHLHGNIQWPALILSQFVCAVCLGVVMAKLIEWPFLRLRERFAPTGG
jgi:hypothetical protein